MRNIQVIAIAAVALCALPAGAAQLIEFGVDAQTITNYRVNPLTGEFSTEPGTGIVPRGSGCSQTSSHTDANFSGSGSGNVQAGFAEGEVAAASYTVDPSLFPLRIDSIEMLFGTQGASVQTETQWTVIVWEGTPNTGTMVASFSSDGTTLPHILLPPGDNIINVQVSVDPGDPEQIIVSDNGSATFSVGFRVDLHNNQTGTGCGFGDIPSDQNAFPITDVSGLAAPSQNWLFAIDCGALGCPAGWNPFSSLGICQPSGDWALRASWTSLNCTAGVGACCLDDGTCMILPADDCESGFGEFFGDGTTCDGQDCPVGACCLPNGLCELVTEHACGLLSGQWQGADTNCAETNCPQPPEACCFDNGSCLNLSPEQCATAGGTSLGGGTVCAAGNVCPSGACCLPDGSCLDGVTQADCTAQGGTYQGDGTDCASSDCPQPVGACCLPSGCLELTQADCTVIPDSNWLGAGTNCTQCDGCPGDPDGSLCNTDIAPPEGDCVVNNQDLGVLLAAYLTSTGDPDYNAAADLAPEGAPDGTIDNLDLGALLADYLNDCN